MNEPLSVSVRFLRLSSRLRRAVGLLLVALAALPVLAAPPDDLPPEARIPLKDIAAAETAASTDATPLVPGSEVARLVDEARSLFDARDYPRAAARLDEALQKGGDRTYEVLYWLAMTKMQLGRFGEARLNAELATRLQPDGVDAHFLLGALLIQQGKPLEAARHFRSVTLAADEAINNPRVTAAYYRLGDCLAELGRLAAAVEAYRQFDLRIWDTHREHRQADEVVPILKLHPQGTLESRLDLLARLNQPERRVEAAAEAHELQPDNTFVTRLYIAALLDSDQAAKALAVCRELDERDSAGVIDLAVRAARQSDELAPLIDAFVGDVSEPARRARAERMLAVLRAQGAWDATAALGQKLLEAAPDDAQIAWTTAFAEWHAGKRDAAMERLAAWLSQSKRPELPVTWLARWMQPAADGTKESDGSATPGEGATAALIAGLRASFEGQAARAATLFELALKRDPKLIEAPLASGVLALERYDWPTAEQAAQTALAVDDESAAAHFILGMAQSGLDENEDAAQSLRKAIRLDGDVPLYPQRLAELYERIGELRSAQRYYNEVLALEPTNERALQHLVAVYLADDKGELATAQVKQAEQNGASADAIRRLRTMLRFSASNPREVTPLREQRYGPAHLAALRQQFAEHPDDLWTGRELALALRLNGEVDEAAKIAHTLQDRHPNDELLRRLASQIALARLDFERAIELTATLAQRYPNRFATQLEYANALLSATRPDDARRVLAALLEHVDNDAQRGVIRDRMLVSFYKFRDFAGALQEVDAWREKSPDDVTLLQQRIQLLILSGRTEDALAAAEAWLDAAPADPQRRELYTSIAVEVGAFDKVLKQVEEWRKGAPSDAALLRLQIQVLLAAKKGDEALTLARDLSPQNWEEFIRRRMWIAQAEGVRGNVDASLHEYESLLDEQLVKRSPFEEALERQMIALLVDAQQYDRGLELCARWKEAAENDDPARVARTLVYQRQLYYAAGRTDDYIRVMERLLELLPGDAGLMNDLGYSLVDSGRDLERATNLIRRAVSEFPLNAAFLDSLGWAYYKRSRFADAVTYLQRATQLEDGQDAVLYDHLADAQYCVGDRDAALAAWKQALELAKSGKGVDAALGPAAGEKLRASVEAKIAALEAGDSPEVAPVIAEPVEESMRE